jgi:hypothetical protein
MEFLLLYLFLITTLILALALVWVYVSYRQFMKQYFSLKREAEALRTQQLHGEKALETERQALAEELAKINEVNIREYSQVFKQAQDQTKTSLEAVAKEARDASLAEVKSIGQLLKQAVESERARVAKELESYKTEKLKQIDTQAEKIIADLSSKVIGEAIDPKKHSELIIKALEEAKKENVL